MTAEQIPVGLNPTTFKPYSVMIAEDSSTDRNLLKRFLLSEKFEVKFETDNGSDLIYNVQASFNKPDVLFLDLNLPVKNGVEIIRELKPQFPLIKIIVISGTNDRVIIQELLNLKVQHFIKKPFNRSSLIEKLAMLLGRRDILNPKAAAAGSNSVNLNDILIPPLPAVALKVMTFDTNNPTGGSEELEKIISPDKGICSDIMKIANSAFYGRSGKVHSIKDAITLLGLKTVKNLVILQSSKQFTKNLKGELFNKYLQQLPVLIALIAFDLTGPLNLKKLRDEVFLSALLRKIGMTILAINFTHVYTELLRSFQDMRQLLHAERREFNTDYIEIGLKVFKKWGMPDSLIEVVANQNFAEADIPKLTDLDLISRLADLLAYPMVGIQVSEEELILEELILKVYKASPELKDAFGSGYFEMIKDHPFFEMVT